VAVPEDGIAVLIDLILLRQLLQQRIGIGLAQVHVPAEELRRVNRVNG
jgi:hypothetical protein